MNESELNKNTDSQVNKSVGSGTPPPPVPQSAADTEKPRSRKKLFITLAIVGGAIITIAIAVTVISGIINQAMYNLNQLEELEQSILYGDWDIEDEEEYEEIVEFTDIEKVITADTITIDYIEAETAEKTECAVTEETPAVLPADVHEAPSDTEEIPAVVVAEEEVVVEEVKEEKVADKEDERIYTAVEQMPQFPGGEGELMRYINSHIKYPTMAAENNIQGRVVVMFVVTKTGKIGEVKIARSKDPDLDKEAIRVVKTLPKFIPGKMNGQAVNTWYTLPVTFKLQS